MVRSDARTRRPVVFRDGIALIGSRLVERPFATMVVAGGTVTGFDVEVDDAEVVDLAGAWVVPGLIDMHVHLELTAAAAPFEQWEAPVSDRMVGLVRNGVVALAAGTLAVRDLGSVDTNVIDYGRLTIDGRVLGPQVVAAGRPIAMTGGHLWRYARQADGPTEVRRAVREQIRSGAGVIKVMATGGLTTPGEPGASELGEDELTAAVVEAAHAGLAVAAHAHGAEGVLAAVRAGVSTIEHGGLIGPEEGAALIETGIALVPTLSPVFRLPDDEGVDQDVVAKTHAVRATYARNIAAAIRQGVPIVAGTDAGCAFNPIGGLVDELREYVALGMSDLEALASATVAAGEVLGTGAGVLQERGPADFLVVADDPRRGIATLSEPVRIVRSGQVLDPATLGEIIEALGGRDESRPMVSAAGLLREGESG